MREDYVHKVFLNKSLHRTVEQAIRPAEQRELFHCATLIQNCYLTVAWDLGLTEKNAPDFPAFSMCPERLWARYDAQETIMFVYELDRKMIGFYSLSVSGDSECILQDLCVLPAFRHRSYGYELLMHAIAEAQKLGCTVMNIEIIEEKQVLREWFEAFGFVHLGTQKHDILPLTRGFMRKKL